MVPEAYVELSNDPPPPAPTPNTQFSNDDWGNVFGTANSFTPGNFLAIITVVLF